MLHLQSSFSFSFTCCPSTQDCACWRDFLSSNSQARPFSWQYLQRRGLLPAMISHLILRVAQILHDFLKALASGAAAAVVVVVVVVGVPAEEEVLAWVLFSSAHVQLWMDVDKQRRLTREQGWRRSHRHRLQGHRTFPCQGLPRSQRRWRWCYLCQYTLNIQLHASKKALTKDCAQRRALQN